MSRRSHEEEEEEEAEDYWVESAFCNDSVVAELLTQLHTSPPPRRTRKLVTMEWGVRQPRSRFYVGESKNKKKEQMITTTEAETKKKIGEPARGSPTTPLSWSGGASNSGGAGDGYEEVCDARSKVISACEVSGKRSRKKKTFAQLKEHESFLLKESVHLKRAFASERMLHKKEKLRNESLKRLKLDMQLQSKVEPHESTERHSINQLQQADAMPISHAPFAQKNEVQLNDRPVLPDLNLIPDLNLAFEEDLN